MLRRILDPRDVEKCKTWLKSGPEPGLKKGGHTDKTTTAPSVRITSLHVHEGFQNLMEGLSSCKEEVCVTKRGVIGARICRSRRASTLYKVYER